MLQQLRKGTASWAAKILLGLLVISFAVWGIGDVFRAGSQNLASIGPTDISVESFRQLYNDRLQALGREVGRPVTAEQARAIGFDRQVLGELVAEATLDQKAKELGLGISDEELVRRIHDTPAFQGPGGQFDRSRFEQVLHSNGYSEPGFIAAERKLALRQQIARTIGGTVTAPQVLGAMVDAHQSETRTVDVVTLTRAAAGDIAPPSDDVLTAYFNDRKAAFRAPEYRTVAVLPVTVDTLAPWIEVSDQDIQAYFEANRAKFGTPEQRTLQQMLLPTAGEAAAAAQRIKAGESFEAVAAARGLKPADIDLGTVTRAGVLDPVVAEAAFRLPEGAVSEPVAGRFGHVLVKVLKIEPERGRSVDEVRDQIRRQITVERAKHDILDRHDKVEDERAAGHTLAEVGAKVGLPVETIEAVDRSGRDSSGAEIAAFAGKDEVLQGAFQSEAGVETDPVQLGTNGFVWYEVLGITKARERTFAEAKDQVLARWLEEQAAERVKAKATTIAERARAGEPLATVAQSLGLSVATVPDVRRAGAKGLPGAAIPVVFRTAPGGVGIASGEDAVSKLVFRVTDARPPQTATMPDRLKTELKQAVENDLLAQYIARLEADLGVSVNQRALDQIVGRDAGS